MSNIEETNNWPDLAIGERASIDLQLTVGRRTLLERTARRGTWRPTWRRSENDTPN